MGLIILAFLFFFIGVVLVAAARYARTGRTGLRIVAVFAFVLAGLFVLFSAVVSVPPGHVGVPVVFGKVMDFYYGPGLHLKNPVAEIVKMSVQERAYTMTIATREGKIVGDDAITVLSNEGMRIALDCTVQYRIKAEKTPWILNNKVWNGINNFEDLYVRPEIRRAIREVCSRYSGQEIYSTRRAQISDEVQSLADRLMSRNGVACVAVNIRDVRLPESVTAAIERKKQREQESQEYDYKLEVERKEAERKRIEAQGIRDFQRTVSEGISPMLIQWKGIEAAEKLANSSNAKVIIFGDSKVPVILGGQP